MIAESVLCLALNIYHEARGEPFEGRVAVAHVVVNRVNHKKFPNDVCDVVWQGKQGTLPQKNGIKPKVCQFSWTCDNNDTDPKNEKSFNDARELAKKVLAGEIKDPTQGSLFFHNTLVEPKWSQVKIRTRKIGNHIFYK